MYGPKIACMARSSLAVGRLMEYEYEDKRSYERIHAALQIYAAPSKQSRSCPRQVDKRAISARRFPVPKASDTCIVLNNAFSLHILLSCRDTAREEGITNTYHLGDTVLGFLKVISHADIVLADISASLEGEPL